MITMKGCPRSKIRLFVCTDGQNQSSSWDWCYIRLYLHIEGHQQDTRPSIRIPPQPEASERAPVPTKHLQVEAQPRNPPEAPRVAPPARCPRPKNTFFTKEEPDSHGKRRSPISEHGCSFGVPCQKLNGSQIKDFPTTKRVHPRSTSLHKLG